MGALSHPSYWNTENFDDGWLGGGNGRSGKDEEDSDY